MHVGVGNEQVKSGGIGAQLPETDVTFEELVHAHWLRSQAPSDDEERSRRELAYAERRAAFERQNGTITEAYWSQRSLAAAAVTEKRSRHALLPFLHIVRSRIHRADDWTARPASADFFYRCDRLGVREEVLLDGTPSRLAATWLFTLVSRVLALADVSESKPTERDALMSLEAELTRIEAYVERASRASAFRQYFMGVLTGLVAIALGSVFVELLAGSTPFSDAAAVAVVAGAVGAVVSVLQRTARATDIPPPGSDDAPDLNGGAHPGRIGRALPFDEEIGGSLIFGLGVVRPCLGAVAGTVVYAALATEFIVINSSSSLLLYASLAFAAGFAERWATTVFETSGPDISDPEAREALDAVSSLPETLEESLRSTLRGPRLVNYDGWLTVDVRRDGESLPIGAGHEIELRPDSEYEVVAMIGRDQAPGLTVPLTISGGVEQQELDFFVELDSDRPALRQAGQVVRVQAAEGSASVRFPVALPAQTDPPPWLWIRVEQQHRAIQNVELVALPTVLE